MRTHVRKRCPCPQTGQRRLAPRRRRDEVVVTSPSCSHRPVRSMVGAIPSTVVSDPSPTEVSAPRPPADDVDALAQVYRVLAADDLAGYCPIYERIALAMADDPASLVLLLDGAPVGRTPVLAFAATHDLVLSDPDSPLAQIYAGRSSADPWPPFRALLHDRTDEVVHRMRTKSIQTNEVGRSAALLSALDHV